MQVAQSLQADRDMSRCLSCGNDITRVQTETSARRRTGAAPACAQCVTDERTARWHLERGYVIGTDVLPDRQRRSLGERGRYLTRTERACVDKVKHSQRSAEHEAARLNRLGESRIKAYECPNRDCKLADGRHAWHVGRKRQERNQ